MPGFMIQGTGSNVGKSMLVAGLCRAATLRGLKVRPFKPQNMSNNAAVTNDGGEIGRAQALQALACGVEPHTDMNPVLLKPESDRGAAVIVRGKHLKTVKARDYSALKPQLLTSVVESYRRLEADCDLVIVEGAGSPAEVNLRAGDIANMGFARAVDIPVILAGDIDRGGVIAQIIGTQCVIDDEDSAMIHGFIVNKFRGDPSLFDDGYRFIEQKTRWQGFGVLPYFDLAHALPAEDALDIQFKRGKGCIKIGCLRLSRIANFDDLDPLALEPDVELTMIEAGSAIPGDLDLLIIPGTKSTIADLRFIQKQGWDGDITGHIRRGGYVLGICGGYQVLGETICDPEGFEGNVETVKGLGLLQVDTVMDAQKQVLKTCAFHCATGQAFAGYEIHIGKTNGDDCARPFALVKGDAEGAISQSGQVMGTYIHGGFSCDDFRHAFLRQFGEFVQPSLYSERVETTLDALADHMENHLDLDVIFALSRDKILERV